MSLEASLGDGVIRLKLNSHVVLLGRDDLWFLCSTELAVKLWVWAQPTAHFHKVIFTHLMGNTQKWAMLINVLMYLIHFFNYLMCFLHIYFSTRDFYQVFIPAESSLTMCTSTFLTNHKKPPLTSFPSVSNTSNTRVMRYWMGATSCQTQFLLGGYSLGQPGVVMEPFSLVMNPPQAAAGGAKTQI